MSFLGSNSFVVFLNFSRSFPLCPNRTRFDLAALLEDVTQDFRLLARDQDRQIEVTAQKSVISADPHYMKQILYSLLTNSLRHGRGTIYAVLQTEPKGTALSIKNRVKAEESNETLDLGLGRRIVAALVSLQQNMEVHTDRKEGWYEVRLSISDVAPGEHRIVGQRNNRSLVNQSSIRVTRPKNAGPGAKSIPLSPKIRPQTLDAAYATSEELLASLKTSESELSDREVSDRLAEHGFNEVAYHRSASILWQLFRNFGNPFVGLLSALSMISFLVGAIEAGSLISFMVVVSVLLRFIQEFRSTRTMARLRALVGTNVTVTRISNSGDRRRREIPLREVVPGDIIHLGAGDMIPADVRLLSTRDLFVSQSVLSGEALPVEKFETLPSSRQRPVFGTETTNSTDLPNLCFMGTNVVSGTATAVVVGTGEETCDHPRARRPRVLQKRE